MGDQGSIEWQPPPSEVEGSSQVMQTPHAHTLAKVRGILTPYGTTLDEIRRPTRTCEIVEARWRIIAFLKDEKGWTVNRIATFLHRDHSTVAYALRRRKPAYVGVRSKRRDVS